MFVNNKDFLFRFFVEVSIQIRARSANDSATFWEFITRRQINDLIEVS